MEWLHHLALGLGVAFTAQNLGYALGGVLLGTLVGVLPGLGPVAAMAMLLPSVHALDATPALIMLAGIYYGAQYGGSTTAILLNVPGEASSVVTALDGYPMARQGRAGPALAVAALGSFFAGCVGTLVIAGLAMPLSALAFEFGAAESFALLVLGLVGAVVLASGSLLKALAMTVLGLLLGQVNTDLLSGVPRFSFDIPELSDGIGFVAIAMGVFGFGEVIAHLGRTAAQRAAFAPPRGRVWPSRQEGRDAAPAVLRGTALGSLLGLLPGGGALLASFASYALEKKLRRRAHEPLFGQGNIRGVAGPESANNAAAQTSFIPLLTLGVAPNAVMAVMLGAMIIKGVQPGPLVMSSNPSLFWGLIASMGVGNLMLLALNLPLVGLWVRLLSVPYRLLFPAILTIGGIGLYTLGNNAFDVYLGALFGVVGYLLHQLGCQPAPLLLGFILGPGLEEHLRRALLLSGGDWSTFIAHPLSATLLGAAALLLLTALVPAIRRQRAQAFIDHD